LTDGKGRTVDFKNTVIIMTSNIGAQDVMSHKSLGFGAKAENAGGFEYAEMREIMMQELKKAFRPEFLNRLDEIIVFHPLVEEDIQKIASLMLKDVCKRLEDRQVYLTVSDRAVAHLAKTGYDPVYGARPLRRAIQQTVEDRLSEELLAGKIHLGEHVLLDMDADGQNIVITRSEDSK